ncbi:MAG TPA: hypothetical protein VMG59_01175, partial [Phycisphaerae bacterium]|nr:hypothetical protein [Phycisphaerae bacterium]
MIRTYNRVLLSKAALFKLDSLANLLIKHDGHCWEIGDLVNQLLKNHRVPLSIISSKVRYSKSHLSELASTARLFPPHARTSNFQDSLLARRIFVRFSGLHMSPEEIRDCIAKMQGKRPRAVKAFFLGLMIQKATHCTLQELQFVGKQNDALCNRCIHDDYRNVIPQLPDNSVKIFNADPPFADYSWGVDGGYKSSRAESSGLRFDTDSNTHAQALEITLALFDLCLSKLKNGGCLLLWQPGAKPDSRIILTKAAESGWDVAVALTWLKSNTGISAKDYPYVPTSERLLVFVPKDMSLLK